VSKKSGERQVDPKLTVVTVRFAASETTHCWLIRDGADRRLNSQTSPLRPNRDRIAGEILLAMMRHESKSLERMCCPFAFAAS
jgi:hypothetical protein